MAYEVISRFKNGMDVRKPVWDTEQGALMVLRDAVVTRAGDIETRKKFVSKYTLPAGTYGLWSISDILYVGGSGADPGVPSGVTYHGVTPDGGLNLAGVQSVDGFNGLSYLSGLMSNGTTQHFYDGVYVSDWFDGRARTSFTIDTGIGGDSITSIKANGVEILGSVVNWAVSNSDTAAAVAAAINSYAVAPDYNAVAFGPQVVVLAPASFGADANGYALTVTVTGTLTVSTLTVFADGVTSVATYTPGPYVRTVAGKVYSPSGALQHFSSIDGPTKWNTDFDGAGFLNPSNTSGGMESLVASLEFLGDLAVVARKGIQIWAVDPDPENYAHKQTIRNRGTNSPKTVVQFRDTNVVFLDRFKGVVALRPSGTTTNYGLTDMMSLPIHTHLLAYMATLSETVIQQAVSVVEPEEDNLWLAIGNRVYTFSRYENEGVAAWSYFELGFQITDFAVANGRVYARSGNTIYLYGGDSNADYTDVVAYLRLPSFSMRMPATWKAFNGFDFGVIGNWRVEVYANPDTVTPAVNANIYESTLWNNNDDPTIGVESHAFVDLTSSGGYARLVSVIVHYTPMPSG